MRIVLLVVTIGYLLMSLVSAAEDLDYVDEHWKALIIVSRYVHSQSAINFYCPPMEWRR